MNVKLKNAVALFYSASSFDDIYLEAVANSLDAGATKISIHIEIDDFKSVNTLRLIIKDNGKGFTAENFKKFSTLLDVENNSHKGVGRLVYLAYFAQVSVKSTYDSVKTRNFVFDNDFTPEECNKVEKVEKQPNGTTLIFENFIGKQLNKYANVQPSAIQKLLLHKFLPRFYNMKKNRRKFEITISSRVLNTTNELFSECATLSSQDVPKLNRREVAGARLDLFEKVYIYYTINKDSGRRISCDICVDGRSMNYDVANIDSMPPGYQAYFLIYSKALKVSADTARQKVVFPEGYSEDNFKHSIRKTISQILSEKIPEIRTTNTKSFAEFKDKFPHLYGLYNEDDSVGLVTTSAMIEKSQEMLCQMQARLLCKEKLSENDMNEALNMASRSLTEYVLYRSYVIDRLKMADKKKSEIEIHNLISPRFKTYNQKDSLSDIYCNNVWLLDDKFMSYDCTLSDKDMQQVLKAIDPGYTSANTEDEEGRPDISLIFSADPQHNEQVDVVIVELKKYGLDQYDQNVVIEQLKDRARNLADYYKVGKINQMWYFGILELSAKFKHGLREKKYKRLFSRGEIYYNRESVISYKDSNFETDIDVFLMNYETLVKDAEARNSTFLAILSKRIKDFVEKQRKHE